MVNVAIPDQRDRQYQVIVNPDPLQPNGVTLDVLVKSVTDTTAVAGDGFINMPNQRIAIYYHVAIDEPENLAKTTIAFRNGTPLRLGDVADVQIGSPPSISDAAVNDGEGLLLIVEKQPTGNTLEVTKNVEKAIEDLKPG
jgi:multidrug efflux pump subunit AcrB